MNNRSKDTRKSKKFRKNSTLAAVFFSVAMAPSFVQAESLLEIYERAVNNDHEYQAAKAAYAAGKQSKAIGRAALLPDISANLSYSSSDIDSSSAPGSIFDSDSNTTLTSTGKSNAESWNNSMGVTLTQPLFNLSAWYSYQNSKTATSQAGVNFAGAEQSLIIRTANAYFEALKAVDNLATSKAEEEALAHQLEQTKQRFAVGLTAITEVHEAQAAFDSATANRLINEGNLGIAFEGLEVLTGQSYQSLAPLKESFSVQAPQPTKRQDWVNFALENNVNLRLAELNVESQEYNVKIKKSAYAPTLTGSLSYNDSKSGGTSASEISAPFTGFSDRDLDSASDGATVSVSLNVPLFKGGRTTASYKQAKHLQLQAKEQKNKAQRDIIQQTRSLYLNVVTSVSTVKARKQAIVSSKSALEATQAGYEVGTRDLVDVLNAQRSLYAAERNYHNALYTYILYTLQLKETSGVLKASDIADLDTWLDKSRKAGLSS